MTREQAREHVQQGGKIKVTTLGALAELQQQLAGMVIHAMVLHDVELATEENLLAGERKQKDWIQKTCS